MDGNPLGLNGIEFVEFSSPDPEALHELFLAFGFSRLMTHRDKNIDYYKQNDIHFLLNKEPQSHSVAFSQKHGPCISSMGWRFNDAEKALTQVQEKQATLAQGDFGNDLLAIKGIGDSLIYFVDSFKDEKRYEKLGFVPLENPDVVSSKGFICIDHMTNNVHQGTMGKWADFYKKVFNFTEIRYFDIKGVKTGLTSFALKSPCGQFCIPLNEGTEKKSQINEYLDEYKGPGIQHLAFLTHDIVKSVDALEGTSIKTLTIDGEYYEEVFDRVPNVTEDHKALQRRHILVDGDLKGYILQIFTKNIIGPIFIEIIQRKNHYNFGEGNFGALFRSIEKEQEARGYL